MNLIIRQADPSDAAAIYALEQRCFARIEETFTRRQIQYALTSPRAIGLVAEQDGVIVGWSLALVRRHRRSMSGRIYAVAVDPSRQGRGLGRRLIAPLLDALRDRGAARAYLEVRTDNLGAISLYRKLGFTDHDILIDYYGDNLHAYRMRLELADAPLTV
jgi:ribosomal-protein-alanine acetyltransferase